jgi:CelD/BcsL family acetyltransferase involved in cellulose biosynthesis
MLQHILGTDDRPEAVSGRADLRVELVRDIAGLERHAAGWNNLALAAPQRLPQLSHAWVASHIEHRLRPHESWLVAFAYEGARLVGVLCVVVTPHRLFGRWRPFLRAPYDAHTRSGDALIAEGEAAETLRALLASLSSAVPGYLGIELRGVREGSPTLVALKSGLPDSTIIQTDDPCGMYLRTSGTYEAFQARLSVNFRKSLRKSRNRLAKLRGVDTEFLTGDRVTEADFARFAAIEASGWKGRAGTAMAVSQGLVAFYSTLTHRLAAQHWFVLFFLNADGQTIAGAFMVRFGSSLLGLKSGYDESFSQYAPGKVLFEQLVQLAFARSDIDEINGLTDASWQQDWQMDKSNYYRIWLYPRNALALVFGVLPTRAWLLMQRVLRPLVRAARRAIARWRGSRRLTDPHRAQQRAG